FINSKSDLKNKYGTLMDDIDGLYKLINQDVYKEMWMNNIYTSTSLMRVAKEINTFKAAMLQQSTSQDQNAFFEANINKLKTNLKGIYESYSMYADLRIFAKMLADAHAFQGNNQIETIQKLKFQDNNLASAYAGELITESKLNNSAAVFNDILSNRTNLLAYSDNLMKFQSSLEQDIQQLLLSKKKRWSVK
ncbi:S46 family peptidase, partial [Sphingobacterium sp. IITKGP-BTPF85]|uniref:S46 family peptidase n=1 Tax=Sphingobacterium sp. IITKGP-BTPF85 TaxID=1338009 RepID=UPI0021CFA37D